MTNEHFKGLSLAQGHTAEMNAARENAERWCEAVGKLEAAKDAEIAEAHRRIEELTAELEQAKDGWGECVALRAEAEAESARLHEEDRLHSQELLRAADLLATERAAREQAESALSDEHIGRVQAEKSLAYFRECTQRRGKMIVMIQEQRLKAEHERDTALARVKELERNESNLLMQAHDARVAKKAAETALASARTVISLFAPASAVARAWLTSHPAPVAAWQSPQPGPFDDIDLSKCIDPTIPDGHVRIDGQLVKLEAPCDGTVPSPATVAAPSCGRAWCKPDNRCADCTPQCTVCGRWSGHCGCVVPAPVAAPCAGCAELKEKIERVEKALNGDDLWGRYWLAVDRVKEALR